MADRKMGKYGPYKGTKLTETIPEETEMMDLLDKNYKTTTLHMI